MRRGRLDGHRGRQRRRVTRWPESGRDRRGCKNNDDDQCDVDGWTDIVAVSAGDFRTVGLADGTVVAVGSNLFGQCDVDGWTDIITRQRRGFSHGGPESGRDRRGCGIQRQRPMRRGRLDGHRGRQRLVASHDEPESGRDRRGCETTAAADATWTAGRTSWPSAPRIFTRWAESGPRTVVAVGSNGDSRCDVDGWTDILVRH